MAKNSIINKIIGAFRKKSDNQKIEVPLFNFYIPDISTLHTYYAKEKLSGEQVFDFLNYVASNYYLSAEENDALIDFGARWSMESAKGLESLEKAKYNAETRLINNLLQGSVVDIVDILWVSEKIYVDDKIMGNRRIVTKVLGEKSSLQVEVDRDSNQRIGLQIEELRRELNQPRQILDYNC